MATNQFEVFGVDLRDIGRLWLTAWRDLLFGEDSPLRQRLDSMVSLTTPEGTMTTYQAGKAVGNNEVPIQAIAVPDELVLSRTLSLPAIAEADLDAALMLEVSASSPFAPDDTAAGWRVTRTEVGGELQVDLVIVSRSAAVAFMGEVHGLHDAGARELWAKSDTSWVLFRGFGEKRRESDYRRRLWWAGGWVSVSLALVLVLAGLSTFFASRELVQLEDLQREARQAARDALVLRDELAEVNAAIVELNTLRRQLPSPQIEIARLTNLLPDTAYVVQYTQNGRKIRLRGRSTDAAALQQALTDEPIFLSVTAPQAISRVGNSNEEQFFLDLELKVNRQ